MDLTDREIENLLTSFPHFMEKLWKERELTRVAPLGRVEFDILEWMQFGPELRGILALRGIGKTHFACGYMDWLYFKDPNHKCLIVSKSESEAKRSLYMTRRWISTTSFLKHLAPDARRDSQRDSANQFDCGPSLEDRTPSCAAKGIDGQLEGGRAHTIIPDDIETGKNTKTLQARMDLDERVKQLSAILYPKGEILYLGTYHHEESVYIKLQERGYEFRSWPIMYPKKSDKIMNLSPMLQKDMAEGRNAEGEFTLPHRFTEHHVTARKKEGRTHFAMQYMLIADLGDTLLYPLRLRDLIVFPIHRDKAPISIAWGITDNSNVTTAIGDIPSLGFGNDCLHRPIMYDDRWEKYSRTIMWIDPSGRGEDKTGYAIVAELNGNLWVKAVGGLQGGYDEQTLHTISSMAKTHDAREIYVEDNFGQGMFVSLLEPAIARCFDGEHVLLDSVVVGEQSEPKLPWRASIETRRVHGQKEIRIISNLEPVMNGHRLIVSPEVAADQDLQYQMTRITKEPKSLEHEDELESLAQAVWIFQDVMHQDPMIAAKNRLQQYIQDELDEMRSNAGEKIVDPNWMNHTHEIVTRY